MMRAIVQRGPGLLVLEDRPMPVAGPAELLVRVRATGICGSDLHVYKDASWGEGIVLGHEICGEVVARGAALGDDAPAVGTIGAVFCGDWCGECELCGAGLTHFCQRRPGIGGARSSLGGLAEYLPVPARAFLPAPEGMDPALVTLAEPLSNALRALDRPEVFEARTALVIGCGPLGLVHVAAARRYGIERVVAVEGRRRRRAAALAAGADAVIDPADDLTGSVRAHFGVGPDIVVEAVGLPATSYAAFNLVRPHGTVFLMGVCGQPFRVNTVRWLLKELTIRTSIGASLDNHREGMELIRSGAIDGAAFVTRRVGLAETPDAFADLIAGADEVKIVVEHDRAR